MPRFGHKFVTICEAESAIEFTILKGETLLSVGTDDPSDVENWLLMAALCLETVPSCLHSFQVVCCQRTMSNRDRVGTGLSILRDATRKLYDPLHASLSRTSEQCRGLIEAVCGATGCPGAF
jgi:hypothetical protein